MSKISMAANAPATDCKTVVVATTPNCRPEFIRLPKAWPMSNNWAALPATPPKPFLDHARGDLVTMPAFESFS